MFWFRFFPVCVVIFIILKFTAIPYLEKEVAVRRELDRMENAQINPR